MFKRKNKSKAEILKGIEQKTEVNRQRVIVRDQIAPLIIESTKNINDAKVFLGALSQGLGQAFMNKRNVLTVEEIDLVGMLDVKNERYEDYKKILDILKAEKISVAIGLLEGFSNLIDTCVREEMNKKVLSELDLKLLSPDETKN